MVGAACCANPPTLSPTYGAGHVTDIAGLSCYVSGNIGCGLAILLITDIFGYQAPLLRMLADKVAASGFYVVVPDFFHGDPYHPHTPERPLEKWLKDHDPIKAYEEAIPLMKSLKHEQVSKVGVVGFCWGGKVAVELTKHKEYLKAGVLCHPFQVTVADMEDVDVPIAILGAELDTVSPPALLKQFEEVLKDKYQVDSFVKIFRNVTHGWTVRYDTKDPVAVKAAEEAHVDMLDWLVKYLKPRYLYKM